MKVIPNIVNQQQIALNWKNMSFGFEIIIANIEIVLEQSLVLTIFLNKEI